MNINIRHVEAEDVRAINGILSCSSVMLGTMRIPYTPDARVADRIALQDGVYKLVAEVEGNVVGVAIMQTFPDVARHNHVGEIDLIAVHEDYQQRGIAKALINALLDLADNWLQLERTGLLVWSDNARAISLYEAFGFEHEGTIRHYARRPGGFADANVYGRLAGTAAQKYRDGIRNEGSRINDGCLCH